MTENVAQNIGNTFFERLAKLTAHFIVEMGVPGVLEVKVSQSLFEAIVQAEKGMLSYSTNGDNIAYKWIDLTLTHGTVRILPEDAK